MSQVWSRVVSVLIQRRTEDERPSKNYPQKLTTQRQKSFESHLSLTLMRVKLVSALPPNYKISIVNAYQIENFLNFSKQP